VKKETELPTLYAKAQDEIDAILAKYPTKRSAVLPLCHLAQAEYGYMSPKAIREVASILDLDATEVQGIVGFYSLLREERAGEYSLEICNDLPCALRGADQFVEHVCQRLDVNIGETTKDGLFTVKTVMCIAACSKAPVIQINSAYHEKLDKDKFERVLEQLRSSGSTSTQQALLDETAHD
jgi:NADH-quinone oxidoreductase subunit E